MMKLIKISAVLMASMTLFACQSSTVLQSKPTLAKVKSAMQNMPYQVLTSRYDFATTVNKIQQGVKEKGMTVFAVIDHQAAAQQANLNMQPASVIIFGTPKAGTPLMQKDPYFALQLPLKVLVTEQNGQVQVIMTKTDELIKHSNISKADVENSLAKAEGLIATLIQ